MINRRTMLAAASFATMMFTVPAIAAETVPYTAAAFETAQKAGRPMLVEVHAPWCPTCKAQTQILSDIKKSKDYDKLLVLLVDFDTQKDAVKRLGAQMQSTLIAFKDGKETGRSVGDTNPASLAVLVAKTI